MVNIPFTENAIQIEVLQYIQSIRSRFTYDVEPMSMSACRFVTALLCFSMLPNQAGWRSDNTVDLRMRGRGSVNCCSYRGFSLTCDRRNNTLN
jgi:hypothetical protein